MCNIPADAVAASCQKHSIYLSSQDQKRLDAAAAAGVAGEAVRREASSLSLADKSIRHETFVCVVDVDVDVQRSVRCSFCIRRSLIPRALMNAM
jgi:hypothetical protein